MSILQGKDMKKVAIYARVSTSSQDSSNQLLELRIIAKRMGYEVVSEFIDNGISGSKGREGRPAVDLHPILIRHLYLTLIHPNDQVIFY